MSSNIDVAVIFDAQKQVRIFRFVMFIITLILAIYSYIAFATPRVSDKIYSGLQSNHYCVRRLNPTRQVGCTSNLGGNTGIAWQVREQNDLKHILETGPTPPYVVILNHRHYTKENIMSFIKYPDRVAGVIFKDDKPSEPPSPFSPEDVSPNRYSGLYANDSQNTVWQNESQISGIMYLDIPFPIFLMNDDNSIAKIDDCFNKNLIMKGSEESQSSYPLCGIQLDSFMLAAVDTSTCINSHSVADDLLQNGRRCVNIESENIFAYYKEAKGPVHIQKDHYSPSILDKQSVVMLIAKLTSLSMFTNISPGADSTITSVVTLLAVAEALGKPEYRNNSKVIESHRNIVFSLLDSEPLDYIGSTTLVEQIKQNMIPLNVFTLDNIQPDNIQPSHSISNVNITSFDYVINLDQLAPHSGETKLYMHSEPQDLTFNSMKLNRLKEIFLKNAEKANLDIEFIKNNPLPPTSVHQFIKQSRLVSSTSESKLLGSVFTNYNTKYTNPFYHSIHDDALSVGLSLNPGPLVEHLTKISTVLARSIYELAFGVSIEVKADKYVVSDLLHCYLMNSNCTRFTKVLPFGLVPPSGPVATYRNALMKQDDFNEMISFHLLNNYLGEPMIGLDSTECLRQNKLDTIYNYVYINGEETTQEIVKEHASKTVGRGLCLRSQVSLHSSQSPAYVRGDGEFDYKIDNNFPAWTVSLDGIRNPVRVFMVTSPLYGVSLLSAGFFVTIVSFLAVNWLKEALSKGGAPSEVIPRPTLT